ncbi:MULTISPECIES: helix-turn-helix domain-containing protein [Micromonospora]|jgi:transcriptional regulator with XRE-family HTH domain|uniref:Helix-turn-helix domain-containing protein n=1 Tax=Micromonospora coriariae TaxID=285665 RepID=A0A1C4UTB2_9ACTN|nr:MULTISPECIES: helix-turn-helix transcriptional regulator [Micromonospora]MBQ0900813.1 helix-turn-helix transcriptional regulator [Micromonospora sp. U21]SCE74910.1 Helix-turn-helix domain-containing protein [Micromonospora coriariae]
MVLLRRVIGDALRARRQGQQRTLREVSTAANVSLGYLSEIERGHKEPSSELLAAICDALGARLSELLREVSDTVALAEQMPGVLVPMQDESAEAVPVGAAPAVRRNTNRGVRQVTSDGKVAVSVRQESPLKATLRSTRVRPTERDRDVVCAA